MKQLNSAYDFYRLEETQRKDMIGLCFKEKNRDHIYFPIQLTDDCFNYGICQGLIVVTPILKSAEGKWFRVAAFSPDDLDLDLDFNSNETHIRWDVIEFIRKTNKKNMSYTQFLTSIQTHFGMGILR
jgi:hypothetical protein